MNFQLYVTGFATWLEFILPENFDTTKNVRFFDLFNIRKTQVALRYDSLNSTRPMTNSIENVRTPSEISDQFDTIAYDKGNKMTFLFPNIFDKNVKLFKAGAVLRQFEHVVGSANFKLAMSHYLSVK